MSVAEAAHRPAKTGRAAGLWLGFLIVIGAAVALAWYGAGSLRPEVTKSGLQFRTVKSGTGKTITQTDAALMDYVLTANDGTVFDSSQKHGGAQPFAMGHVYPGFAEAMGRMQEGGVYRFTLPQNIAWGGSGEPEGWPKGSPLTFDVRVQKVVPGGAAMLEQQMQQQQMQQMLQQQMQQQQQGGGSR